MTGVAKVLLVNVCVSVNTAIKMPPKAPVSTRKAANKPVASKPVEIMPSNVSSKLPINPTAPAAPVVRGESRKNVSVNTAIKTPPKAAISTKEAIDALVVKGRELEKQETLGKLTANEVHAFDKEVTALEAFANGEKAGAFTKLHQFSNDLLAKVEECFVLVW